MAAAGSSSAKRPGELTPPSRAKRAKRASRQPAAERATEVEEEWRRKRRACPLRLWRRSRRDADRDTPLDALRYRAHEEARRGRRFPDIWRKFTKRPPIRKRSNQRPGCNRTPEYVTKINLRPLKILTTPPEASHSCGPRNHHSTPISSKLHTAKYPFLPVSWPWNGCNTNGFELYIDGTGKEQGSSKCINQLAALQKTLC
eukprot:2040479-Pleurochrysis_carterae.AAC.1